MLENFLTNQSFLYISLQADFQALHYLGNKPLSSQLLWFAFEMKLKQIILQYLNSF